MNKRPYQHEGILLLLLLALGAGIGLINPSFLAADNLLSILKSCAVPGILALGALLVLISGNIDISFPALAALSMYVTCKFGQNVEWLDQIHLLFLLAAAIGGLLGLANGVLVHCFNLPALIMTHFLPDSPGASQVGLTVAAAVVAAIATGALCGAINGLLISHFQISAILATFGTMQLFTGIALVVTGGQAITGFPEIFLFAGNGDLLGLPNPFLLFAALSLLLWVIVARTPFGLRVRSTGSNSLAALFSGIRVRWILFRVYLSTGILASLTGLLMIARTNSAKADYGSSYLLQSVLVAVLGGVRPTGGSGSVGGVVMAVVALQMLASGFNMLHFSNFARDFFWGLFLLLIMVINHYAGKRG